MVSKIKLLYNKIIKYCCSTADAYKYRHGNILILDLDLDCFS